MKNTLKISLKDAKGKIKDLSKQIATQYGINVEINDKIKCGYGENHNGITGDLHVVVGTQMRLNVGFLRTYVDTVDFLKTVCALYHEEQHTVQTCYKYMNKQASDNDIRMAVRSIASQTNPQYYQGLNRYNNDLAEIEAEAFGISKTYEYIKTEFPKANADKLISDLVNDKIQQSKYFIEGHYESFSDIIDAFANKFDIAKEAKIKDYYAYVLRPSQDINKTTDECIRYLQACVRENKDNEFFMTQFNNAASQEQCDLMIASITCNLHPEITYEKLYPCLVYQELSTENIWGYQMPKNLKWMNVKAIDKRDIDEHINKTREVFNKIQSNEMKMYFVHNEKLDSKENETSQDTVIKDNAKDDVYQL